MTDRQNDRRTGQKQYTPTASALDCFNVWQNFIGTNVLTKFNEDWPINVANIDNCSPPGGHFHKDRIINVTSRVLTRKNSTPPCGHFHEHWTTNVTSRVLTRKTALSDGGHIFYATETIFLLGQDIIGTHVLTKVLTRKTATPPGGHTHVLTKFHEDWTINVNVDDVRRTTHDGQKAITIAHHEHVVLR
ncbi:hypothetical protein DPMN_049272 [Dreissena polymorpha]|uniref:Uncharacterized protein n=1 Tax=Dreissena polymorpha TaxID=45954 RepID=A0A9D4CE35_DREPO|nr:hypothetical protein DPMN_049272 [Dreissena polymorpha]